MYWNPLSLFQETITSIPIYVQAWLCARLAPKFHFMAFRAAPRHSSSKLGSALGLHLNSISWHLGLRLGIAQASLALRSACT